MKISEKAKKLAEQGKYAEAVEFLSNALKTARNTKTKLEILKELFFQITKFYNPEHYIHTKSNDIENKFDELAALIKEKKSSKINIKRICSMQEHIENMLNKKEIEELVKRLATSAHKI